MRGKRKRRGNKSGRWRGEKRGKRRSVARKDGISTEKRRGKKEKGWRRWSTRETRGYSL